MNKFESCNIIYIPSLMNYEEDMLFDVASNHSPSDDFTFDKKIWN